ncbi:hypothetical protein CRUP_025019 [Coryphaenoides rupestris]|nr:hypothetical protein CRUP_025019 [Coryphaenoides rupestris]
MTMAISADQTVVAIANIFMTIDLVFMMYLEVQGIDYSTWGFWQNNLALAVMMFLFLSIAYTKLHFIKKLT